MPNLKPAWSVSLSRYGEPEVLCWRRSQLFALGPHEVRIETLAAGVNYTDIQIRSGVWPVRKVNPFPYTPGVEVVGQIVEIGAAVSNWKVGQVVITMMQGLGGVRAERPGAYATYVTVLDSTLALVPSAVDIYDMAAIGLAGVTAYWGLRQLGPLDGKRVMVTGAAGNVGLAAVMIARASGASVCAVVASTQQKHRLLNLGVEAVEYGTEEFRSVLGVESVDAVLDVVGGELFSLSVNALRKGGVLSLVGAVAGSQVNFDAWQLIRPIVLTGYSTETLNGLTLKEAIDSISTWLIRDEIHSPPYRKLPLKEACIAHRLVENKQWRGRILLT